MFEYYVPARKFGLATAWIDRQRLSEGGSSGATVRVEAIPKTDYVFFSLGEMAEVVEDLISKCISVYRWQGGFQP